MRTGSSLRRIASLTSVLAVIIATAGIPSGSAVAKEADAGSKFEIPMGVTPFAYLVADKAGNRVENPSIQDVTIDGKRYLIVEAGTQQPVVCFAWPSPAPTHSRSNNNMSYGTQAQCDFPVPVKVKSVVYSGADDNHLYDWQADTGWKFGVSGVWAGSHNGLCVAPIAEYWQWQLLGYAQADTNLNGVYEQFWPYPGDARNPTQCADMI